MASWSAAVAQTEAPPIEQRRRPRARARSRRDPLRSGVVWIVAAAVVLAGLVALNVAVLRLNVQLDKLDTQRAHLRAEKQSLASQLSMSAAAPRIQLQAQKSGLVPANPAETTFVRLGPRTR